MVNVDLIMLFVIILIVVIISVDMACVNMLSHFEKCRNDVYRYA